MPIVERDGVTIRFTDAGDGPAVLLLHGHTFDTSMWDEVATCLDGAPLRLLRPDLRGHGASSLPPRGYHTSHHAADMAALLARATPEPAVVVGFSVGGAVALELALAEPARVAALLLIDPVMPDRPFEPEFMTTLREVARAIRSDGVAAAMAGPWLDGPLLAPSLARPGMRARVADMVARFPGAEYLATERDRVERDWTVPGRLGEIAVPTVVLVGERDLPGFRAWAVEAAEGIPGARLEVVPGAGHLVPLEEPSLVADRILELTSLSGVLPDV